MPDEISIDSMDTKSENHPLIMLPSNFIRVGKMKANDLTLYIHQRTYKEIFKYSSSDISKEFGSILIGDYLSKDNMTYVIISDFIEAKYSSSSVSTLTFTHETWDYIHRELAKNFPDNKIVGWHHTHPNYGIFLSSYDLFIQENFFNLDFQVAYVVDPIRKISGFFQNKNGKTEKLSGFYVYDELSTEILI